MSFAVQLTFPEDFVSLVLHAAPAQLGRAVWVSSKLHLAFDVWCGIVTLRDKLLSPPAPPSFPRHFAHHDEIAHVHSGEKNKTPT